MIVRFLRRVQVVGTVYTPSSGDVDIDNDIADELVRQGHAIVIGLGQKVLKQHPQLVAQYAAGWSRTSVNGAADASYQTLVSETLPGGLMGLNSKLVIVADWSYTNSASTKTFATDFGGVSVGASTATTSDAFKAQIDIQNLNSLSVQKTHNAHTFGSAGARLSGTVNTASDAVIDLKCKWGAAVAAESITLIGYSVWHYPGS